MRLDIMSKQDMEARAKNDFSLAKFVQRAAQAGVPEDEVLKIAKGKKEPMEKKRCVEFFQMVQQTRGKSGIFTFR